MSDAYKTARFMHGPFDKNYMEKYIPAEILDSLHKVANFIDSYGYTWGFNKVFVDLHEGKPFICLASKYIGQGHTEIKYIMPPDTTVLQMHISH